MGLVYSLRHPGHLARLVRPGPVAMRGILSLRPPIVHLIAGRGYDDLFRCFGKRPIHAFYAFWWLCDPDATADFDRGIAARFPNVRRHYLANTEADAAALRSRGLQAHFVNHNAFVDENLFRPLPGPRRYDAVHDAVLAPYKRHELAALVPSLAQISKAHADPCHRPYAESMLRLMPHADWLNAPLTPRERNIPETEVNAVLNRARCGLCLSAAEGAMYASVQYLLAGLPVVTTPSIGGRDAFLAPEFTYRCEPEPAAVAAQVARAVAARHDPAAIRDATIAEMRRHRGRFCRLGQEIYDREGVAADFAADFARVFYNKILRQAPVHPATAPLWWRRSPLRLPRPAWR